ncbi:MAG: hypothetical protein ACON5A_04335 [Candidatus Comchoanobacterales bacterium]
MRYLGIIFIFSMQWLYALEVTPVEMPIEIKSNFIDINLPVKNKNDYTWYLKDDVHSFLRPLSRQFIPNQTSKPDGPGIVTWRFQVLSHAFQVPMAFELHFECRQHLMQEPYQLANFSLLTNSSKSENAMIKNWVHDILFGAEA